MASSHTNIHSSDKTHRFRPSRMIYTCAGRVAYCDHMPAANIGVFYAIGGQTYHTCADAGGFFLIRAQSGANITVFIKENAGENVSPAQYALECVNENHNDLHFYITRV